MKIIFATANQNKLREIRDIFNQPDHPLQVELLSMQEAGITADIEETGTTFLENAILKATTTAAAAADTVTGGYIFMADDSGLEIDYLNREPGIYSARYLGETTSYHIKNQNLISRLASAPTESRTARFVCAVAAVMPDGRLLTVQDTMEGLIASEEKGTGGFGYDPIFFLPEYGQTSAELPEATKNAISHRGKALRAMRAKLDQ